VTLTSLRSTLLSALLAAACLAVSAQQAKPVGDGGGTAWNNLSASQRQVLAPLERDWTSLEAQRKAKWIEVANRFPSMPEAERQRVQERMAEWARMTPVERGRARLNFQEAKQLSPEERQQRWEAYQALPDERRRALAERAKPAAEAARKASAGAAPLAAAQPKTSAIPSRPAASGPLVKPVAPTIVQARPGATTTLMTRPPSPPAHQHPGQPKIAAKPDQVNRNTLLPQRGPQGIAATAAASAPAQP
jgi:hypothetical protein